MPHLEYNVDGVTPSSRLNAQQIQDFYVMMRESVWKISLPMKKTMYNGVCIRTPDGSRVIITTWLNWDEDEPILVYSQEGDISFHEGLVFQDVGLGLTYLAIDKKVIKKSPYVRSLSSNIGVGTSLYTIVHGPNGGEPMLFVGKTSFPFYSGKSYAKSNRTPEELLNSSSQGIPLLPLLKKNLSLIQVEDLAVGHQSGLGSPVFNANGRLIGIVAFQFSTWNFVIPSSYIQKKLTKHVNSYLRKKARH